MNNLELCKRIAEIAGCYSFTTPSGYIAKDSWGNEYNPLTDDALCFQLMAKYRVMVDYDDEKFLAATLKGLFNPLDKWEPEKDDIRYDSANRAICLAIIEAHK